MNDEFDRLDPTNLLAALVDVYEGYKLNGMKPGSEHYEWDTRVHRPKMVAAVRERFCQLYDCPEWEFPYHDDYLAWLWIRYRKLSSNEKRTFTERLNLSLPIETAAI